MNFNQNHAFQSLQGIVLLVALNVLIQINVLNVRLHRSFIVMLIKNVAHVQLQVEKLNIEIIAYVMMDILCNMVQFQILAHNVLHLLVFVVGLHRHVLLANQVTG